jgi:hypothetical protein
MYVELYSSMDNITFFVIFKSTDNNRNLKMNTNLANKKFNNRQASNVC